jgi:hypothetical protein
MNSTPQQSTHCVAAIAAVNCTLQAAIGRFERCPGATCPLWDDGKCLFEDSKLFLGRRYVAEHLLELRESLIKEREAESRSGFRSPFHRLTQEHMFRVRRSLAPARDA